MKLTKVKDNAIGFLTLALVLIIWELFARQAQSFYFPPFSTILATFYQDWFSPLFAEHAVPSLVRMFIGYLIASVLGVVIGVLIGSYRGLFETLDPFFEFLRAIPPPIIIPVGLLLLGIGDTMKITVIVFGVFWPVLLNSADGARSISQERLDTARNFGLGRLEAIRRVVFPSALPMIFTGLRVGLALALIMVVISEMIGSTNGLGYYILDAQRTFAVPQMFGGILLLGILGYGLNNLFLLLEARVLSWHHGQAGQQS
ncbi:ABC transporter permease subunit [Rubrobacter marinus]|uniref:ABC transporter permease subunit n=1 Tax=Rubrobacter marinus TaxID=2653852 RepID=A0A6G8Q0H9_9ACTN|nr:ABC transporter permease [Rubrobacter marinus]QIN79966.1 ABC transporter permease subunit [Rubrobacter marinus]